MNEIHKQKIKTSEFQIIEGKTENDKLKSKVSDLTTTIGILKNQLKTYEFSKSDDTNNFNNSLPVEITKNIKDKDSSTSNRENNNNNSKYEQHKLKVASKLRTNDSSHKIFEKRLCNVNEFTINQVSKHLGLLADKIQLGECI